MLAVVFIYLLFVEAFSSAHAEYKPAILQPDGPPITRNIRAVIPGCDDKINESVGGNCSEKPRSSPNYEAWPIKDEEKDCYNVYRHQPADIYAICPPGCYFHSRGGRSQFRVKLRKDATGDLIISTEPNQTDPFVVYEALFCRVFEVSAYLSCCRSDNDCSAEVYFYVNNNGKTPSSNSSPRNSSDKTSGTKQTNWQSTTTSTSNTRTREVIGPSVEWPSACKVVVAVLAIALIAVVTIVGFYVWRLRKRIQEKEQELERLRQRQPEQGESQAEIRLLPVSDSAADESPT